MTVPDSFQVRTFEEFADQPAEYREACAKLVRSHAVNELYGAQVSSNCSPIVPR
jgi:ring-1,2-phenylacetyl-CoA epoxidase subunit PaaA